MRILTSFTWRISRRPLNLIRFYSAPVFKSSTDRSLNLTESAVAQLQVLRQKFPEKRLRVAVEAGGCHGFQYKFQLDLEEPSTEDM